MQVITPNLRHLRVFLEVAKQKSISKAAPKIFLSQPAITQAIGKLEALLEASLFERHVSGMFLTAEGKVWQARVIRCLNFLEKGLRSALRSSVNQSNSSAFLPLLTTTQLRALIAVTKSQSFSVASRQLELSQSSLHRACRDLEELLGIRLFEKIRSSILPTRAAKHLARNSRLAFGEIEQGYYEILALQEKEIGRIVIGSMPLARTSILPAAINNFSFSYPKIGIGVIDAPYADLLLHLRQGEIDFLIGALRFPPPAEDILQEELLAPSLAIVARKDHPLTLQKTLSLEQIANYDWVIPHEGAPTRAFFNSLFSEGGLEIPTRLIETSSQILIRSLLLDSNRLTLISQHQVEYELKHQLLDVLPYSLNHTKRPIGITVRKGWKPTPIQEHFLDLLRKAAAQYKTQ